VHQADTGREYMHAATRHCYYQRAELQLLLRQLRFCSAELNGAAPLLPPALGVLADGVLMLCMLCLGYFC
jgi:hypothetical protein